MTMSGNQVVGVGRFAIAKIYAAQWRQQTEVSALRLLRHTRIAPRLLASGTVRGRSVTVQGRVGRLAAEERPPGLADAFDLLSRVHRVPVGDRSPGRLSGSGDPMGWQAYLTSRIARYQEVFQQLGQTEQVRTCAAVAGAMGQLPSVPLALLHNDPHRGNFLPHGRQLRLIDWELAVVGDPLLDLVRFCWEWQVPAAEWAAITGFGHDHPRVRVYRGVHGLSRLMAAVSSGTQEASQLAERCRQDLSALGYLQRSQPNSTEPPCLPTP